VSALVPLLLLALSGGLAGDAAAELKAAGPGGRVAVLSGLAARVEAAPAKERTAVAPLLLRILADPARANLHPFTLDPLVATGADAALKAALTRYYDRDAGPVRVAAKRALETRGGRVATEILAAQLGRDRSPRARALVALLLGARAKAGWSRKASKALVTALRDPSFAVRGAAAEALTRAYAECRGYEPEAWRPLIGAPPRAARSGEEPEDPAGAPGEVVTRPAVRDAEAEVRKLAPEFYGIPLDRSVTVVVLDFSRSVRGPGGEAVKRRLERSLLLLPSVRRFTVLAFDDRLLTLANRAELASPDFKEKLVTFLDKLPAGKRTELLMPLRTAIALAELSDGKGGQVLIVSDGAPTVAGPPLDDLLARAEGLREKGVRVDAAVHGGREVGLFRFLTRLTGGSYVGLPAPK